MRTSEIVAAVDFDEVIYGWHARAHDACVLAGVTDSPASLTWFPYEEYGITRQQWYTVLDGATDNGYLYSAAPMDGALDALHQLREQGVTIYIVTARGNGSLPNAERIRALTYEYVERWEIPADGLFFTRNKEGVARSINATHAIDDNVENVLAFQRAGAITYLHDQPWNLSANWPGIRRVANLSEFADRILVKV